MCVCVYIEKNKIQANVSSPGLITRRLTDVLILEGEQRTARLDGIAEWVRSSSFKHIPPPVLFIFFFFHSSIKPVYIILSLLSSIIKYHVIYWSIYGILGILEHT